MRVYFDLTYPLVTKEWIDANNPLLLTCSGSFPDRDTITFLLQRGMDANARDHKGRTCLHLWFRNSKRNISRFIEQFDQETLILLIQHGADTSAKTISGVSVSDYAYAVEAESSYPGDLWDSALAKTGHNVAVFRRGHPRKAKYSEGYTRELSQQLWEGIEHLCPYYNDPEGLIYDPDIWEINSDDESSDDDGGVLLSPEYQKAGINQEDLEMMAADELENIGYVESIDGEEDADEQYFTDP
jgi:hypothetical protein